MADISMMPDLALFQWSRPGGENPRLASPLTDSGTTVYVTSPPLDSDGKVVSKGFIMGIKSGGYTENVYVPAGAVDGAGSAPTAGTPGTTITGVVRGVGLEGLDYTTGSSDLRVSHGQDAPVFCNVAAFHFEAMRSALNGEIGSGGESWKVGAGADNDIKVVAYNGDGNEPFWMYDASANGWVYSNDGVSTTPFGTGAGVTGGDGIGVTAGQIDVDLADGEVFKAVSAGAGDAAKAVLFDVDGYVDAGSVQVLKDVTATAAEINKLDGAGATVTAANLGSLTDGGVLTALHTHKRTFGVVNDTVSGTSDSLNITHGLGVTPNWVKITASMIGYQGGDPLGVTRSEGVYDGTNYACLYERNLGVGSVGRTSSVGTNTSKVIYLSFYTIGDDFNTIEATATLTSTQIQLSYTNSDSSSRSIKLKWECGV